MVQSLIPYSMAFLGNAYLTHNCKLETALNSLVKFLFNKPKLHYTILLHNEYAFSTIKFNYIINLCAVLFKYKNTSIFPSHSYIIHHKINTNY